uniref:Uncharacterized protein n=1 Tax=Panagrolaimus sp. ES5 TaxID=591445 RepID=A0AC34FC08_9BILA
MFQAAIFWSILLFSIIQAHALRGALIRNGRAFDQNGGGGENDVIYPLLQNPDYQLFNGDIPLKNQQQPELFRFARSSLPGAHQNFFRGRRDDSDEAESARFG